MRRCEKCGVNVGNPVDRCPLCYSFLAEVDGIRESPSYPDFIEKAERNNIFFRILLTISIAVCGVCLTINFLTFQNHWWALLVIVNVLYMWAAIVTALKRNTKVGFNIMVQVIILAALMVIIDFYAGDNRWALNYVVPLLFVTAMLSITIILIVKRVAISGFILYFILIALLGFIPVILLAMNIITVSWPAIVSALYSAISLVSIFVLANNATKIELKKRFRI